MLAICLDSKTMEDYLLNFRSYIDELLVLAF